MSWDTADWARTLTSVKSLQLGENTLESFIQAANLGASYIEFDVQLTKDLVPVVYHDFLVSETGIDVPTQSITLEQFLSISDQRQELANANSKLRRQRTSPLSSSSRAMLVGTVARTMMAITASNDPSLFFRKRRDTKCR